MLKKRFMLTVNPKGGKSKGPGVLTQVLPIFESAGLELDIQETEYAGHVGEIINTMNPSRYDGFCLIGGDGTVHEVVNGLLTREDGANIPIGCIPAGTGNSFMCDLDCLDPVEAANRIVKGEVRPIDVAKVVMGNEVGYAFNVVGWGMVTDINITAEKIRWLGDNRYTFATPLHVLKRIRRLATIIIEGVEDKDEFLFAIGCNTQYTGKGMRIAPHARLDDGLIDLVIVRDASRLKLLKVFPKIFDGSHVSDPIVEYHQVKRYSIIPEEENILNIDGELKGTTPFEVEVLPKAFQVFI